MVNLLLKVMEDKRDKLLVIVAGYKHLMDDFFSFNPGAFAVHAGGVFAPRLDCTLCHKTWKSARHALTDCCSVFCAGLPSRFPIHITFADYSQPELLQIMEQNLKDRKLCVDDKKWLRTLSKCGPARLPADTKRLEPVSGTRPSIHHSTARAA